MVKKPKQTEAHWSFMSSYTYLLLFNYLDLIYLLVLGEYSQNNAEVQVTFFSFLDLSKARLLAQ